LYDIGAGVDLASVALAPRGIDHEDHSDSRPATAVAFIIALDAQCDERGFFARTFCEEAFAAAGIHMHALQANLSYNARARTLRGLHYQTPYEEPKLVQCVRGQVWDVALDLRPSSPAYGQSQ